MSKITSPLQKGFQQSSAELNGNPNLNIDLAWAESGLPESYKDRFYANPYFGKQASGGFLGINQKADQMQLDIERDKYIANLLEQASNEAYESPEQSAARLRAAGINPDLAGLDGAGSASSSTSTPNSAPDLSNPMEHIQAFSNFLINLGSFGAAIPAEVKKNQGLALANQAQTISNAAMLEDLVYPHLTDFPDIDDSKLTEAAVNSDGYYDLNGQVVDPAITKFNQAIDELAESTLGKGNKRWLVSLRKQFSDIYKANRYTTRTRLDRKANAIQETTLDLADAESKNNLSMVEKSKELARKTLDYQINSMKLSLLMNARLLRFNESQDSNLQTQMDLELNNNIDALKANREQIHFNQRFWSSRDAFGAARAANAADRATNSASIVNDYKYQQMKMDFFYLNEVAGLYNFNQSLPWMFNLAESVFYPNRRRNRNEFNREYESVYGNFWNNSPSSSQGNGFHLSVPGVGSIGF